MSKSVVWGFPNPQSIVIGNEKKSYVAQFSQSGALDPVATVLEDSTGFGNTWTRVGAGSYLLTFGAGAVAPVEKLFIPGWMDYAGSRSLYLPISDGSAIQGRLTIWPNINAGNVEGVYVECFDDQWVATEWSTLFGTSQYYLEFYIYP